MDHMIRSPPSDERYLTLPSERIAFLGGFAELPNSTSSLDAPLLMGDLFASCDILSLDEFARGLCLEHLSCLNAKPPEATGEVGQIGLYRLCTATGTK